MSSDNCDDESHVPDCAKAGEAAGATYPSMRQTLTDGLVDASFKLLADWIDSNRALP
jgi:hypothetical protein